MKKILVLSAAYLFVISANAQVKKAGANPPVKPQPVKLKNMIDSFSYAAGMNIAANMKEQGITEINASLMARAMEDAIKNRPTLFTQEQANMTLQEKLQEFTKKKSGAEKAKGEAFLNENKKRSGVISLPSGLQYEILQSGEANGMKPSASDTVVVHYAGTLIDGKEFDSSVKRGEPATFPVNGVIRGWVEILQLMSKGDKWKVYIPSELGYGDHGAGGSIAPGAALIFEINLIDIKPAARL